MKMATIMAHGEESYCLLIVSFNIEMPCSFLGH